MQANVKSLEKSMVEITVEVNDSKVEKAKDEALKRFAKEVKIDGYREGKAPKEKILEKVGEKAFEMEALDIALQVAYAEAVKENNVKVIAHPKVEIISKEPFKFQAVVAVLPEVEVGDYQKIQLKKEEVKVEKKEVEAVIKDLQKSNAEAKEVKDRKAQKGDRVEIDFVGKTLDGVILDNTSSKNHPLVLGEGNFIPGFEEGVEGMNVGEEKVHKVKFPKEYHAKHLADQEVNFEIKLHKIEEMVHPELNDDFAKKMSGGKKEKWSDVEKDIEDYLKQQKEAKAQQKLESDLINELLKIAKVEIPPVLIDEEVEFMLKDLQQRLAQGGMSFEKYLEMQKKKEAEIREEMRVEAEKRVKARMILDKLLETEKPEVNDKEVEAQIEMEASRYPESQKKDIRENFKIGSPNRLRLQHQLKIIKLLRELTKTLSK